MKRLALALGLAACSSSTTSADDPDRRARLAEAESWMYQLQGLGEEGALEALADSDFEVLVVEPGIDLPEPEVAPAELVEALKTRPDGEPRLLLAYINIGQAEDYRDYWQADWVAPTEDSPGEPDFLAAVDPDGWAGNYPVLFWRPEWQALWLGEDGRVAKLARLGYDGVYLDWVAIYEEPAVVAVAEAEGVSPEDALMDFIEALPEAARETESDFLVIPQNAPQLVEADPERYLALIDGIAVEDTFYHGDADAEWDDPAAGDLPSEDSLEDKLALYAPYLDAGKPVLSVDYCVDEDNAARVYEEARAEGLIPLVTRVPLSRMTETPPF